MRKVKRVTVRAYNLRPGDILAMNPAYVVESTVHYPGTWSQAFVDIRYTNGRQVNGFDPDNMFTVVRSYA